MITGRRSTDWLREPAAPQQADGDRRGADRRGADRRAPRRAFDPLFAATLVNQVTPGEAADPGLARAFAPPAPQPRRGGLIALRI